MGAKLQALLTLILNGGEMVVSGQQQAPGCFISIENTPVSRKFGDETCGWGYKHDLCVIPSLYANIAIRLASTLAIPGPMSLTFINICKICLYTEDSTGVVHQSELWLMYFSLR
jgi:hypothetical protein